MTSQLLTKSGYLAEDHYVTTADGYRLNIVRAISPFVVDIVKEQVAHKQPVLFVHGITSSSLLFIIRLRNAKPRNLIDIDLANFNDQQELNLALDQTSPSSQSVVTLLLDLGHEVWLLSRRGATNSRTRKDKDGSWTEIKWSSCHFGQHNFWNFSLDEQARYDLPRAVEYILKVSNRPKLSLVGHSLGAALILMSLSLDPNLEDKGKWP